MVAVIIIAFSCLAAPLPLIVVWWRIGDVGYYSVRATAAKSPLELAIADPSTSIYAVIEEAEKIA